MNPWKISQSGKVAILLFSIFFQNVLARSILKDLVLAHIFAQIIKPRFVPLPIPFPLPLKFQKHTYKPYPVPLYSHALSAEHVGHSPLHYGLSAEAHNLAGHDDLSALASISAGHDKHSALASISEHEKLSALASIAEHDKLSALASVSDHDKFSALASISDHDKLSALASISDHEKLSDLASISASHDSHYDDLTDGIIVDKSNQLDNIHDDIEAIGGLDVLTDIDHLGEKQKWW